MYSVLLFAVLSLSEVATCLPSSFLQHKANLFGAAVQLLRTCGLPEVNDMNKFAADCKKRRANAFAQCVKNNSCTRTNNKNKCNGKHNNNNYKSDGDVTATDIINTNCNFKEKITKVNIP